ncbi:amidoligase family protein [Robinsoniella peoriensis]|uniref:amidoligase family protein n=1 Tax=Robinsoniella peoriensis TaxID=180332 RepID=UPI003752D25B
MKTQRFGIEIEMTGITREEAAAVIANHFGTESYYIGTYYKTYGAKDRVGREWKATFDSSITAQKRKGGRLIPAGEEYKCEIVSPILTYEDIPDLQEIVRKLRNRKALVNEKCGIHIHVDASRFTPQTLRNIVNIMASKEDILYKSLRIEEERLWYCKKVNENLIATINKKKPKTMEQLKDIWYAEDPNSDRGRHYNTTRYHGLNLHSTFTKGTVEFRIFNSTLHAGEVKAYIQFCLALTHQALVQKKASSRRTETDNEKYAFRCWMLRLGLIGDEFKTCRLHFLKNLEGNSAWRHGA